MCDALPMRHAIVWSCLATRSNCGLFLILYCACYLMACMVTSSFPDTHQKNLVCAVQKTSRLLGCMTAEELRRAVVASEGVANADRFLRAAVRAAVDKVIAASEPRQALELVRAFEQHKNCLSHDVHELKRCLADQRGTSVMRV
jgi:hypothetical protein